MWFDSHAHLDDIKYDRDRHEMLMRAREQGISFIVNVGYDVSSSRRSVALAAQYDFIYAAVGIHPHDAADAGAHSLDEISVLAANPKVVALGEMGLDYYRDLSPRDIQKEMFRRQIELAVELDKPVIIHDRDAHSDVMDILRQNATRLPGCVLHCFSGSPQMARECLKLGFYISVAGPVTFGNAKKLREVAAEVPLDRLLVETDAPYLTPEPHRGKRNESAYVAHVGRQVAEIRGIPVEDLSAATTENAKRLFRIK